MKIHDIKAQPKSFQDLWDDLKTHEVRINDRGYEAGDLLLIREIASPGSPVFTGRIIVAFVTNLTSGGSFGLPANLCVMSVKTLLKTKE